MLMLSNTPVFGIQQPIKKNRGYNKRSVKKVAKLNDTLDSVDTTLTAAAKNYLVAEKLADAENGAELLKEWGDDESFEKTAARFATVYDITDMKDAENEAGRFLLHHATEGKDYYLTKGRRSELSEDVVGNITAVGVIVMASGKDLVMMSRNDEIGKEVKRFVGELARTAMQKWLEADRYVQIKLNKRAHQIQRMKNLMSVIENGDGCTQGSAKMKAVIGAKKFNAVILGTPKGTSAAQAVGIAGKDTKNGGVAGAYNTLGCTRLTVMCDNAAIMKQLDPTKETKEIVDEVAKSFKQPYLLACSRPQQYKAMTDDTVAIEALKSQGQLAIMGPAQ